MKFRLIAISAFFASQELFAGGMSTGGGSAVVCRDGQNRITEAHVLDLFEGRERFGYVFARSNESEQAQRQVALQRLAGNRVVQALVERSLNEILHHQSFLPRHLALHTSSDLGADYAVLILDGCRLEQIAYYEDDGNLAIATNLFENLTPTDRAAFYLHEAVYRLTRANGATDSSKARKLVAELFSSSVPSEQVTADFAREVWSSIDQTVALDVEPGHQIEVKVAGVAESVMLLAASDFDNKPRQSLRIVVSSDGIGSTTFTSDKVFRLSFRQENTEKLAKVQVYYDGDLKFTRECSINSCGQFSLSFLTLQ